RAVLILLLGSSFVIADATTQPATQPGATTQPATQSAKRDFPTAAELAEKIQQIQAQRDGRPEVAHIDLNAAIIERPSDFSWFGEDDAQTLQALLARIELAKDDPDIDAILVTLRSTALNLAQAQEVRAALARAAA